MEVGIVSLRSGGCQGDSGHPGSRRRPRPSGAMKVTCVASKPPAILAPEYASAATRLSGNGGAMKRLLIIGGLIAGCYVEPAPPPVQYVPPPQPVVAPPPAQPVY